MQVFSSPLRQSKPRSASMLTMLNLHNSAAARAPEKPAFQLSALRLRDQGRDQVEAFICDGFKKVYDADISVAMPVLLAIRNGDLKAALGIRGGESRLFVEQYLEQPLVDSVASSDREISRNAIAEIGHLFSNTPRFALPLLLTAGVSLFCCHYEHIIFCATNKVRALIERTGINVHEVIKAEQSKLLNCAGAWGIYYETHPYVVSVSTQDIINTIMQSEQYMRMFDSLADRIRAATLVIGEHGHA